MFRLKTSWETNPVSSLGKVPPLPRTPQRLSDLIQESTIKAAYEDHNETSYEDALKRAAAGLDEGYLAWRKIMRALDVAYTIRQDGLDFAPMPRVQFLHRRLLEIVYSEHLTGMVQEGIVEFFNDVCPCGGDHKEDALRKLAKRMRLSFDNVNH